MYLTKTSLKPVKLIKQQQYSYQIKTLIFFINISNK